MRYGPQSSATAFAPATDTVIQNAAGVRMLIDSATSDPTLRIVLPGAPLSDRSIVVLFPEHVTARPHGDAPKHLYLWRTDARDGALTWRRIGSSLEYERDLPDRVHLLARATLEDDGVRFRYEFTNRSSIPLDMIYSVTDPRLTGPFHDVRLERTYVHHVSGFDLLASETPARLTMSLDRWLPARYLASFTWPVPKLLVERRADGITYYSKSRPVDEPFIATRSIDGAWVVASFARDPGNVWSNPELTCQHVDPERTLPAGAHVAAEVKMLVLRGTLIDALNRAIAQRASLE